MGIEASVGEGGSNNSTDVKVIQAALNNNLPRMPQNRFMSIFRMAIGQSTFDRPLRVDGQVGQRTFTAIKQFQRDIVKMTFPDGRVDPGGRTLRLLKEGITPQLSFDNLSAIMALGNSSTLQTYLPLFEEPFERYELNTALRQAHFLAQIGHESLSLKYTEEIASGENYEGRLDLGNIFPGDGVRFKGRGFIQLTGRANYESYSQFSNINFLEEGAEKRISEEPELALDVSLWFWDTRRLNAIADNDDILKITRRINGGTNGLDDRKLYLNRAKFFLLLN